MADVLKLREKLPVVFVVVVVDVAPLIVTDTVDPDGGATPDAAASLPDKVTDAVP